MVEFLWHPLYAAESAAFVADFLRALERESGRTCEVTVCKDDAWKLAQARRLGFRQDRSGAVVKLAGKRRRLVVLVRHGERD